MKTIMMSALAAIGLFTFIGSPVVAQENAKKAVDCCASKTEVSCGKTDHDQCTWSMVYEGKRSFRKYQCHEDQKPQVPNTVRIEVKPEDRQAGDIEGMKYVGKRTERAYFREVPVTTESAKGHVCSWRMVYEKKQVVKRDTCIVDGAEHACLGMDPAGECLGMK